MPIGWRTWGRRELISPRRFALQRILAKAAHRLGSSGIESPDSDARQLLAHVLDVEPSRLLMVEAISDAQRAQFEALLDKRVQRVPLQHLTGLAYFRHERINVGRGVFVPRPETEVMTGWAIQRLREMALRQAQGAMPAQGTMPAQGAAQGTALRQAQGAVVVEVCAGSGAIAKSIAAEVPGVVVHAVEVSESAAGWAARNLADTGVHLHVADMATALPELDGSVDLVIANPPYIPLAAYESVPPEVRDHDPVLALFSGADGLDALRVVARVAARLLVDGGVVCAEHAEVQAGSAPAIFAGSGAFSVVRDHLDLAGRSRFVTAVRVPRGGRG